MICSLRRYEWEALANLLGQGYAFQSAYCMIQSDENVIRKLRQGMPLTDLLTQGHHGLFYDHLRFFLRITGVGDAIHASLAMADFLMKLRRTLFQQASYPLLLLCFSFAALFLFSVCVLPQLMQSFALTEMKEFTLLLTMMRLLAYVIILMGLSAFGLWLLAKYVPNLRFAILQFLQRTHLPSQYCSYLFAGYFTQMQRHGISTRQAFTFLASFRKGSLLSSCAQNIADALAQGEEITDSLKKQRWIEPGFVQSWQIAQHTQQLAEVLSQYQKRQEEQWKEYLKRFGVIIQVFTYSFVAGMVILVYQILLLPLQLLESF